MPSTTTLFDSYVLKCWAEAARRQTDAADALADALEDRPEDRRDDRPDTTPDDRPDAPRD